MYQIGPRMSMVSMTIIDNTIDVLAGAAGQPRDGGVTTVTCPILRPGRAATLP